METTRWLALWLTIAGILFHFFVAYFFANNRPLRFLAWGVLYAITVILIGLAGLQAPHLILR